jgi:hypothetical protein
MPAYNDHIEVDFHLSGQSGIKGRITLPDGLHGEFKWKNKIIELNGGVQEIDFP